MRRGRGPRHRLPDRARSRRLLRWGPDGPESPRPSDISTHAPAALHPCLHEDGTVHFDERAGDEPA
ncbi:DUF5954 family protein [Streptomyces wedmorensis]|uniref:DUF5954 family protein n=1 Tax=Streptomyces wedmorensis TaxID=43759 RepID=UPI003433FEEC